MVGNDSIGVDVSPVITGGWTVILPASFHPGEYLKSERLRSRWDDARYLVGLILTKLARQDADSDGSVRLQAKYLKNIMDQRHYAAVIQALLDGGIIERRPYLVGARSFGYVLSQRFVNDRHVRVPLTDPRLIARLKRFHEQAAAEHQSRMKPVHRALEWQQQRLRIHGVRAREILAGLPSKSNPFDTQGILIADIENRQFHCNVGRYGRFSNNITNLKRELRSMLHVEGHSLGYVDLSCAQPAFIAKLIDNFDIQKRKEQEDEGRTGTGRRSTTEGNYDSTGPILIHYDSTNRLIDSSDFRLYRRLTQSGEFYDFMAAQLRVLGITRDDFKRRFLSDVIAKRKVNAKGSEYPSVVENEFQRLFPTVYRVIREINRDGFEHANLVRALQRTEAEFVVETVAADLVTRYPQTFFSTLHDAIYCETENLPKVEQAFRTAFDASGFRMSFKVVA